MNIESATDDRHVIMRLFQLAARRYRPPLGWAVLCSGLLLALLPAVAIREAGWIDLRRVQVDLEWVGVLSLLSGWWLVGRLRARAAPARQGRGERRSPEAGAATPARARARTVGLTVSLVYLFGALLWVGAGIITVSQVLVHWIPGPVDLWRAAFANDLFILVEGMEADLSSLVWRYGDWMQGVQEGGAYQDDFVFLSLFGVVLWLLGGATALLALSTRDGLIMGAPALWALATFLFYGRQGRLLILVGFSTTLLLHLLLDQQRLERGWARQRMDFSPGLLMDRLLSALAAAALIFLVAAVMPNVVVRPITYQFYRTMTPVYDSVDKVAERMFPDLKGGRRGLGRIGSGLPNRFLLDGGTELGRYEVMRVATDYPFGAVTEIGEMPPRLYMRRGTFVNYDGRGWNNTNNVRDASFEANRAWREEEDWPGRVALIQRVRLTSPTAVLPAAGEPAEFRMDYELERRSADDLVSIWSGIGPVDRFDVTSYVPAMSAEALRGLPAWGALEPLPDGLAVHLRLPDSVSAATRSLAERLAADAMAGSPHQPGPFAVAEAIEGYLRGIKYNLAVPGPPPGVDVAHFFLFDLKEGYCDYYTTAFAVLARLNGLPTRFATGYIGGYWDLESGEWTITEAEAHSWPEVYFPEFGWIPFEPTAGRPSLQRQSVIRSASAGPVQPRPAESTEPAGEGWTWNWQMLFWLLPLLAVLYAVWSWLERRPQDPWLGLLAWGRRLGRPHRMIETELEYGQGLSTHLAEHETEPERRRRLTRNVIDLTEAVSKERYGTESIRAGALTRAAELWRAIRTEIRRLPW